MDFGTWTSDFRLLHIADIRPEAEQSEKRAQNVLPFSHPVDRFDVQRVHRKEGGDEGAAPQRAGQFLEQQEQEQRVGDMEEQVGEVMAGRIQLEQLTIEHVRKPGEGMPVGGISGLERPCHTLPA